MANPPTPGAVANTLVRYLLTKAGLTAGGLNAGQWQQTMATFDDCCAYTGESLRSIAPEKELAVPMNRTLGGLHVFGNVVPATAEASRQKAACPTTCFYVRRALSFLALPTLRMRKGKWPLSAFPISSKIPVPTGC